MSFFRRGLLPAVCALMLGACAGSGAASPGASTTRSGSGSSGASAGGASRAATAQAFPDGDWTRFDFDAARSGVGPSNTGLTAANIGQLSRRRVHLDGTVDSSAIQLHAVPVHGRPHDLLIVTTTYGRTIALDAGTGRRMWEFVPRDIHSYAGTFQITTATPVADPSRRYVFAATPDGLIRKLNVSTGREVRGPHWPARVTLLARREKLPAALNISGGEVIVTTGGYIGDIPPYQGHVVTLDRGSGRILRVWNSLCADAHRLLVPSRCPISDSAIWARSGAVVEPGSGRLLVATGNADSSTSRPFDGRRFWSDSVLELTPDARRLLHNWTPPNQAGLSASDSDLGSTAPALLPGVPGRHLAVQGGKDGKLRLLDLDRLNGTGGGAGARLGGELQTLPTPGGTDLFTAPAVWRHAGRTEVFVSDNAGTAKYALEGGAKPRLRLTASLNAAGTSPVIAGGLLYVFNPGGWLNILDPANLQTLRSLPAAPGHWNSPIVLGGRIILPEGDANQHASSGTLDIFHLPGR